MAEARARVEKRLLVTRRRIDDFERALFERFSAPPNGVEDVLWGAAGLAMRSTLDDLKSEERMLVAMLKALGPDGGPKRQRRRSADAKDRPEEPVVEAEVRRMATEAGIPEPKIIHVLATDDGMDLYVVRGGDNSRWWCEVAAPPVEWVEGVEGVDGVHRSAITGQFVDGEHAARNPDTTIREK